MFKEEELSFEDLELVGRQTPHLAYERAKEAYENGDYKSALQRAEEIFLGVYGEGLDNIQIEELQKIKAASSEKIKNNEKNNGSFSL